MGSTAASGCGPSVSWADKAARSDFAKARKAFASAAGSGSTGGDASVAERLGKDPFPTINFIIVRNKRRTHAVEE